jgi:hypothetical protein
MCYYYYDHYASQISLNNQIIPFCTPNGAYIIFIIAVVIYANDILWSRPNYLLPKWYFVFGCEVTSLFLFVQRIKTRIRLSTMQKKEMKENNNSAKIVICYHFY